eukprot:gene27541-8796_t
MSYRDVASGRQSPCTTWFAIPDESRYRVKNTGGPNFGRYTRACRWADARMVRIRVYAPPKARPSGPRPRLQAPRLTVQVSL